jgi:hypothetical protein
LKVKINTHPETSVDRTSLSFSYIPGVMVIVQSPFEWPRNGHFIAAGSIAAFKIKPTVFSASDGVRGLSPADRQCNYDVRLFSGLSFTNSTHFIHSTKQNNSI